MKGLKVLAYFDPEKWVFAITAQEGPDENRIIAQVEGLILQKASFSKDKSKAGAISGLWDKKLNLGNVSRLIFGEDEDAYGCLDIKFDFEIGKYIIDDFTDALRTDEDPSTYLDLERDKAFKREVKEKEVEMLFLEADQEFQEIRGYFCKWKRGYTRKPPKTLQDVSGVDEAKIASAGKKVFPKDADTEEIINCFGGAPSDQVREITSRAATEGILRAGFTRNEKRGSITVFLGSSEGMVCRDSDSMEPSAWGEWDEDGEFLEVSYPGEVIHIYLNGDEEVVESLDDPDTDEE
jgi:hypothetical protein